MSNKKPKIIFAVQGEGRGHLSQAIALREILIREGYEICAVLVGTSSARQIPDYFFKQMQAPVIRFESPNFKTDAKMKSIRVMPSIFFTMRQLPMYIRNMRMIRRKLKEFQPDLMINFYDPLIGLFNGLFRHSVPVISIAHQYIFHHPGFQFPSGFGMEKRALKAFTAITCWRSVKKLALSMYPLPDHLARRVYVVPPILRKDIFSIQPQKGNYILVYLLNAGYSEEIIAWHKLHPEIPLHCFTDRQDIEDVLQYDESLFFHRISDSKFLKLMAGAKAYASTAGFESICEAMYLGKPAFMVPVGGHFEQFSNARDAARAGAGIYGDKFDLDKFMEYLSGHTPDPAPFRRWVDASADMILGHIRESLGSAKPGNDTGIQ
jgi:uncharacterized protein (TIGR00661 family)